jgi:hypothetical protein
MAWSGGGKTRFIKPMGAPTRAARLHQTMAVLRVGKVEK